MAKAVQESDQQSAASASQPSFSGFAERHFSVAEIAELWNLSTDYVQGLFQGEPGVLVLGDTQPRYGKRRHTTLRIPQSVAERVYRRMLRK